MVVLTLDVKENLWPWTQWHTQGYYRNVITLNENDVDKTYATVERCFAGKVYKFFEELQSTEFVCLDESFYLDCGLDLTGTYTFPATTLTFVESEATANVLIDQDDDQLWTHDGYSLFVEEEIEAIVGDATIYGTISEGDHIRDLNGGFAVVVSKYGVDNKLSLAVYLPFKVRVPENGEIKPLVANEWTADTPVTSVSGLWHLEGQTVDILADGKVYEGKTIVDGATSWEIAASRVSVGLPYNCLLQTLPPSSAQEIIEDKKKNVKGVAVSSYNTVGLEVGATLDSFYDIHTRRDEPIQLATQPRTGMDYQLVRDGFDYNGQVYYQQSKPLPATILGYVAEVILSDD